jgi:16S rRNA (guanine(966)-N(2))-methyltransferase RsmD
MKKRKEARNFHSPKVDAGQGKLRIIGGEFRGRQIAYSGDPVTRPMKDDIREAVFNLVGGWTPGKAVFDLFAGTGALALEALSRGASRALVIERHFPTVRLIKENARALADDLPIEIAASDTFFWTRKFLKETDRWPSEPWLVFCCPPYQLYVEQQKDVLWLVRSFVNAAPDGSLIVVESDSRFDASMLPEDDAHANSWTIRQYSPAVISILKKNMRGATNQN